MKHNKFPEVASLPSFNVYNTHENIPLRSIEVNDINRLSPSTSPYAKRTSASENKLESSEHKKWSKISISTDDESDNQNGKNVEEEEVENENYDEVNDQLSGTQVLFICHYFHACIKH
jgi:hypothetical protein